MNSLETTATAQPTTPAPVSTSSPAPATSITASSAPKSSAWSSIATGVVFFLCVLGLGVALIAVVKLYRKNAPVQLQSGDQDDADGDDDAYRMSSNGSVYFRAQGQASEAVVPDVHDEGGDPSQTYEVLVFGVDSATDNSNSD